MLSRPQVASVKAANVPMVNAHPACPAPSLSMTFQDQVDAIVAEREARNANIGHGLGVALKKWYQAAHSFVTGSTALHHAVVDGDVSQVKTLARRGELVNLADSKGVTPLMLAVQGKDVAIVEILISHGCHVNAQDAAGNTALHHCFVGKNIKSHELLLKYSASVDPVNLNGESPLYWLTRRFIEDARQLDNEQRNQIIKIIRSLVSKGANMDKAFQLAVRQDNDVMINVFLAIVYPESQQKAPEPKEKNEQTTLFEKVVSYTLQFPAKTSLVRHKSNERNTYEIVQDGLTYNLTHILHTMDWEQVSFGDQDYALYAVRFVRAGMSFHQARTHYNEVDKSLAYWFSQDLGYVANDFLSGTYVRCNALVINGHRACRSVSDEKLLPSIGLLAAGINKLNPAVNAQFLCRGQADADRRERAEYPLFVSLSKSYSVCYDYATRGIGSLIEGRSGSIAFFHSSMARDISSYSSVNARESVSVPRKLQFSDASLKVLNQGKGMLPHYFGKPQPVASARINPNVLFSQRKAAIMGFDEAEAPKMQY